MIRLRPALLPFCVLQMHFCCFRRWSEAFSVPPPAPRLRAADALSRRARGSAALPPAHARHVLLLQRTLGKTRAPAGGMGGQQAAPIVHGAGCGGLRATIERVDCRSDYSRQQWLPHGLGKHNRCQLLLLSARVATVLSDSHRRIHLTRIHPARSNTAAPSSPDPFFLILRSAYG